MDVRTMLAIEALEARCNALDAALEQIREDLVAARGREEAMVGRVASLEERVGNIKVAQGFHREPIPVPPPPKILREIGLLPPAREVET